MASKDIIVPKEDIEDIYAKNQIKDINTVEKFTSKIEKLAKEKHNFGSGDEIFLNFGEIFHQKEIKRITQEDIFAIITSCYIKETNNQNPEKKTKPERKHKVERKTKPERKHKVERKTKPKRNNQKPGRKPKVERKTSTLEERLTREDIINIKKLLQRIDINNSYDFFETYYDKERWRELEKILAINYKCYEKKDFYNLLKIIGFNPLIKDFVDKLNTMIEQNSKQGIGKETETKKYIFQNQNTIIEDLGPIFFKELFGITTKREINPKNIEKIRRIVHNYKKQRYKESIEKYQKKISNFL